MELVLKIILSAVTTICFLGGINLMTKGTKAFLPDTLPLQPRLDNLFRFLSGIYLGLGFSKVDAITVFANVFLKAQSDGNMTRMRKILDYIKRFENQEYAQLT